MTTPITARDDGEAITISRVHDLWSYHYGARRRPFVHPLATPAGHVLSVDAPDDHPWHHGLWFTIKFVNDENFWEEYDAYGVLRHQGPPRLEDTAGTISVAGDLDWIRPDRTTVVLRESRVWTFVMIDESAYALDFETTLTPEVDATLDRTPFTTWGGYGGLAFRGRPDLRDTRFLLDDGSEHQRLEGVPSAWLDLSGAVGSHVVGLAVIDDPHNPSHPVEWYGSTRHETYEADGDQWSNFVNAAFLWNGPLELAAGRSLRFRYRILVHDGLLDPEAIHRQGAVFGTTPR